MTTSSPAQWRLFTPIKVGPIEVRNRTVITAHGVSNEFRSPLLPPEPYIEYVRRRAAGGVGLIVGQPILVEPTTDYPEPLADRLAQLADAVHAEGATIVIQICHFGASWYSDKVEVRRSPLWALDTLQSAEGDVAHKMTDDEIELMIAAFGRAARVVADSGLDGVEVHGAHGYLIQQSYLPWLNGRDDQWGDPLLFLRRVLAAARENVGVDKIVGFRCPVDDLRPAEDGGIGAVGQTAVAVAAVDTGLVDYLTTSIGSGPEDYAQSIGSYRHEPAEFIGKIAAMRRAIDQRVPVVGIGKVTSPAFAESLLQSDSCDMVAMTRAHIADPDLLAKVRAGEGHRIRICVGAVECSNRKSGGGNTTCWQNPEVLREKELATYRVDRPKRVVVVGAGPAGLKAAITLVHRGHDVVVAEEAEETGGLLRAVRQTSASALFGAVEHLSAELALEGVTVSLGRRIDASALADLAPDEVVLATGAVPDTAELCLGACSGHVISSATALQGGDVGSSALVYDAMGTIEAALVAEALARQGIEVTLVSRFETVAPYAGYTHRVELPGALERLRVRSVVGGIPGFIEGRTSHVVTPHGANLVELEVDSVVAVTPMVPDLALVPAVESLGVPYHLAGNSSAHRTALHAFREGAEVGMLP